MSTTDTLEALIAFYPSRDLAATRHFYGDLLGLVLARDQGSCLIFEVGPGGYLGFCAADSLPGEGSERHPGLILTLVTDGVDRLWERLGSRGVASDGPPRWNEHYGIYHFFVRAPDGYRLEIQRFRDKLPGHQN